MPVHECSPQNTVGHYRYICQQIFLTGQNIDHHIQLVAEISTDLTLSNLVCQYFLQWSVSMAYWFDILVGQCWVFIGQPIEFRSIWKLLCPMELASLYCLFTCSLLIAPPLHCKTWVVETMAAQWHSLKFPVNVTESNKYLFTENNSEYHSYHYSVFTLCAYKQLSVS